MFFFRNPSPARLQRILDDRRNAPATYFGGHSLDAAPEGFRRLSFRRELGRGEAVFETAQAALRNWTMLRLGWVSVFPEGAPIATGIVVGNLIHKWGTWAFNPCRVVAVFDEFRRSPAFPKSRASLQDVTRFGFTYATLPGHVAVGIERFLIVWDHADDSVRFEITSISQIGNPLLRTVSPLVRRWQQQFLLDGTRAMQSAVSRESNDDRRLTSVAATG